jgi:hypothetical protein
MPKVVLSLYQRAVTAEQAFEHLAYRSHRILDQVRLGPVVMGRG